jgi:hypothetical protein
MTKPRQRIVARSPPVVLSTDWLSMCRSCLGAQSPVTDQETMNSNNLKSGRRAD